MKIIVFSDSHRNVESMECAVRLEQPDYIIHLGDLETDAFELGRLFPSLPLCSVPGNCDIMPKGEKRLVFDLAGRRFFVTHGHMYHVKMGLQSLVNNAQAAGADLCLFGHTHIPLFRETHGLILINPGSVGYQETYGVLTIVDGKTAYEKKRL